MRKLNRTTDKASKFAPQDFISNLPDNVITNIMDRLPLQHAVRTGILSRNWRFKWTLLSQLVFDEKFFQYLNETKGVNNYGSIISRLLLHLKGSITKFVLSIDEQCYSVLDVQDINHWILFLSKNGIKDLTIEKWQGSSLMLPTHLFSCLELKHLNLHLCCLDLPTNFHGFPNLLTLELGIVKFESGKFGEFFTRCPVLEVLNMTSIMKLVEFSKLPNLKALSLAMYNLDNRIIISSSSIFELVGFFPKLQVLDLDFLMCKFTDDGAKRRFPATFPSLKTLKLRRIDLGKCIELACTFEIIMSFPNMQTLEISSNDWEFGPRPAFSPPEIDYSTMALLKLQSVEFTYYSTSENEVCVIKYILACSPFLKKIVICPHPVFTVSDDKFLFARKLLKLHRASPVVDIDLS